MKLNREKISRLSGIDNVMIYDIIDSTNSEAKRLAKEGYSLPFLLCAEEQTAGRGRLGRSFYSPRGTGLYMSLAFLCQGSISDAVTLTSAAAVAVAETIDELCSIHSKIKWVNDIYIGDRKVCGILAEAVHLEKTVVIIGIGINCTTWEFPEELRSVAGSVGKLDRSSLAAKVVKKLMHYRENAEGRPWMEQYRKRSLVLGKTISYTENGETKAATALEINNDGGLVILESGKKKILSTGEITVRIKEI